ncbi:hypothetical protein AYY17_01750 [Morganella psychrotolerans]|uniref:Uncharacterized protein n=1 Tax=Morganella psychrotolerans TaxID=368603 RepID=A0A1B8HQ97_9GAMM|nr:hypothetical protein AYY17_01750 [Morganella psychrotolerans]
MDQKNNITLIHSNRRFVGYSLNDVGYTSDIQPVFLIFFRNDEIPVPVFKAAFIMILLCDRYCTIRYYKIHVQ